LTTYNTNLPIELKGDTVTRAKWPLLLLIAFSSCSSGGYSEKAGEIAQEYCECIDSAPEMNDFVFVMASGTCMKPHKDWFGDDKKKRAEIKIAMGDKCPEVYGRLEKIEESL
jgi:hypothetical protein